MQPNKCFRLVLLPLFFGLAAFSQVSNIGDGEQPVKPKKVKGFHAGLYVGTLFANKYSAETYDGYGFDINGKKNDFANSVMYRRIVYDYGGGNFQTDQIAIALNVNHGDWSFDQTDMPLEMKYNAAFLIGMHSRYCFDKKNAIILNVNASKLTASGQFTITTVNNNTNPNNGPQGLQDIRPFGIVGGEQRLAFQLGYQKIDDSNDKLNFFWEAGFDYVLTKYDKNRVDVNGLIIDLTYYYTQPLPGYSPYRPKNLTGYAPGIFAGLGLNLSMSPKWTVQLLYSPSLDKINIGEDPRYKLQHPFGLRAYYNL